MPNFRNYKLIAAISSEKLESYMIFTDSIKTEDYVGFLQNSLKKDNDKIYPMILYFVTMPQFIQHHIFINLFFNYIHLFLKLKKFLVNESFM